MRMRLCCTAVAIAVATGAAAQENLQVAQGGSLCIASNTCTTLVNNATRVVVTGGCTISAPPGVWGEADLDCSGNTPTTRALTFTAPLYCDQSASCNLSANRTIAIGSVPDTDVIIQPVAATLGSAHATSLIGATGGCIANSPTCATTVQGGAGTSVRAGGDARLIGGNKGTGVQAGDAIVGCPDDSAIGDCGVDVCGSSTPTCTAVLIGHQPANGYLGSIYLIGDLATNVTFSANPIVRATAQTGLGVQYTAGSGTNAVDGAGGNAATKPSAAILVGAQGGNGTATQSAANGGDSQWVGGVPGTNNGGGAGTYGALSCDGAAINIGTGQTYLFGIGQVHTPVINVGESTTLTTVSGTLALPPTPSRLISTVDPANNYVVAQSEFRVEYTSATTADRAVILPQRSAVAAGRVLAYEVSCTANEGHTVYAYLASDTNNPIATLNCTSTAHLLQVEITSNLAAYVLDNGPLTVSGAATGGQLTGSGSAGKATCWKTATTLGYCSSAVGADGTCTCN